MGNSILRLKDQFSLLHENRLSLQKNIQSIAGMMKKAAFNVFFIFAILVIFACGGGEDNAVSQDSSVRISGNGLATVSELDVANTSDGKIIAVWTEGSSPSRRLKFNTCQPGVGWGAPRAAGAGIGNEENARVAMNSSGNVMMVWVRTNSGTREILAASFNETSGWGTTKVLDATGNGFNPQVTIDDSGNAVAAWNSYVYGAYTTITGNIARYASGGWSIPQTLNSERTIAIWKISGNSSGKVMAIWNQSVTVTAGIEHKYNTWVSEHEAANTWLSPYAVGNDIFELDGQGYYNPQSLPGHYYPTISVDEEGNAFAAWLEVTSAGGGYGIHVNRLENSGAWETPQLIGTTPADMDTGYTNSYSSIVSGSSGSAYFNWIIKETVNNAHSSNLVLASYKSTTGWMTENVLTSHPYACYDPVVIEGKNGTVHVFWLQFDANDVSQIWTKSRGSNSGWSPSVRIDNSSGGVGGYKVIRKGSGSVAVIWTGINAGVQNVRAKVIN